MSLSSQGEAEIVAALVRVETKLDHVLEQVRKINGRVGGLENWKHEVQVEQAAAKARSEALLTKREAIVLFGILGTSVSAVAGVIGRLL